MQSIHRLAAISGLIVLCSVGTSACMTETGEMGGGTKGVDAHMKGDYKTAETIFLSELEAQPNNPYVQFNLADTYLAEGRRDEAIALYRKAADTGRGVGPDRTQETGRTGTTIQYDACDHLKALAVQDEHCTAG